MKISKYLHSCLLIEDGNPSTKLRTGTKILVDPGRYSFDEERVKPEQFVNITAILITHNHGDHADVPAIKIILKNNPGAEVFGNSDTKELLAQKGILVELFESGTKTFDSISIEAIFSPHQPLLMDVPKNTAYLVNKTLLVTGDSIDERMFEHTGIPMLASAVTAPWANLVELAEFMVSMEPKHVIPLHDGFAKEIFRENQYRMFANHLAGHGIELHLLGIGEVLET